MNASPATRDGGCLCGSVRYRISGAPIWINACHCTDCQRLTGSAFGINIITEASNIELLSGELRIDQAPSPSGRGQTIHRCAACGTRMWSNYGTPDVIRFVAAGTLDEPAAITPDIHIFTRSKLPWITLPEGALAVPEFFDARSVWPPESLARWKAALRP